MTAAFSRTFFLAISYPNGPAAPLFGTHESQESHEPGFFRSTQVVPKLGSGCPRPWRICLENGVFHPYACCFLLHKEHNRTIQAKERRPTKHRRWHRHLHPGSHCLLSYNVAQTTHLEPRQLRLRNNLTKTKHNINLNLNLNLKQSKKHN